MVDSYNEAVVMFVLVGFCLGVTFALAVKIGYVAFHLIDNWVSARKAGKKRQVRVTDTTVQADGVSDEQYGQRLADRLREDSRRSGDASGVGVRSPNHPAIRGKLPAVIKELQQATGLSVAGVLRKHAKSYRETPEQHDGCEICEWQGVSHG